MVHSGAPMRCFLALDVPPHVRSALAATVERLRASTRRADVRWVSPEAMHLTLRFLGETADVAAVRAVASTVAARHQPIRLRLAGLGTFPGPAQPRVVWAGLTTGAGDAATLAAALEAAVVALGFAPEPRPFRAHVTLGRVRSHRGSADIRRALEACAGEWGAWTAGDVVLFRSHLGPRGARYEALARLPLGAPPPAA